MIDFNEKLHFNGKLQVIFEDHFRNYFISNAGGLVSCKKLIGGHSVWTEDYEDRHCIARLWNKHMLDSYGCRYPLQGSNEGWVAVSHPFWRDAFYIPYDFAMKALVLGCLP
jgi:hypothetical protein